MLPEYKRRTNIGVGLGLILQMIGRGLSESGGSLQAILGLLMILVGGFFFIWGCTQYAKAKGRSGWFGALGLLSLIGLIILVFLSDQNKES